MFPYFLKVLLFDFLVELSSQSVHFLIKTHQLFVDVLLLLVIAVQTVLLLFCQRSDFELVRVEDLLRVSYGWSIRKLFLYILIEQIKTCKYFISFHYFFKVFSYFIVFVLKDLEVLFLNEFSHFAFQLFKL